MSNYAARDASVSLPFAPPPPHLVKVCKTLCQKINSRQNILIYSTIFDRRRHFLGLVPRIIYACFNFICCLTNATPIRQRKICYFDTFKVAPLCKHAHNFLRLLLLCRAPKNEGANCPQGQRTGINMPTDCSTLVRKDINRFPTGLGRHRVSRERASINQSVLHSFVREEEVCVEGGSLK